MANRESYLNMLPTGIRIPLRKLFDSDASIMAYLTLDRACTTGITMSGAMTDGMVISGACSDNGIEITGVCGGNAINVSSEDTAISVYVNPAASASIDVLAAYSTYMDDASNATVAQKFCLNLNQNGDTSGITGFMRVYAHGATATDCVIYLGNNGANKITNLFKFSASVAPVSYSTIKIDVAGTGWYIPLSTTADTFTTNYPVSCNYNGGNAITTYVNPSNGAVIDVLCAFNTYMDDASNATVSQKFCLNLNQNGDTSGITGFMRVYAHGATATDCVIYLGNNGANKITNLFKFSASVAPVIDLGSGLSTCTLSGNCKKIAIEIAGSTFYLVASDTISVA